MSICVFGIFVADLCFFANDIPIPGQTILGKKYIIGPGGKGSNQAIAAARAGGNVSFISKVGKDSYADLAISLYERDKINYDGLVISEKESTGAAGILINEQTGQNAINVVPGAAGTIDEKLIDSKLNIIESSNVFLTQLETPKEVTLYALKKAKNFKIDVNGSTLSVLSSFNCSINLKIEFKSLVKLSTLASSTEIRANLATCLIFSLSKDICAIS